MTVLDSAAGLHRLSTRAFVQSVSRLLLATTGALLAMAVLLAPPASAHRRHRTRRALATSTRRRHHWARPKATSAGAGGCANAYASVRRTPRSALQQAVVCLINNQRTERGLPALRANSRLDRSAQSWTDAMVSQDEFTHGVDFAARITAVGYNWSTAGENIATGFATPAAVVRGWMASAGHCRNILTPTFAAVGTGVSASGVSGFGSPGTWTQDFALWMGSPAPSGNWGPADGCPY
jgi:uncharacterized protein YkwD